MSSSNPQSSTAFAATLNLSAKAAFAAIFFSWLITLLLCYSRSLFSRLMGFVDKYVLKLGGPKNVGPGNSLARCPAEVVLRIASSLSEKDLDSLARSSSYLYQLLNQVLYEANIENGESSALFWAARTGTDNTIKHMKTFGADLEVGGSGKYMHITKAGQDNTVVGNALHIAIIFGHLSTVNLLIKEGLSLEHKSYSVETVARLSVQNLVLTPLELSMMYNQPAIGMILIRKGVDVNRLNSRPLRKILSLWDWELKENMSFQDQILWIQILLQSGANLDWDLLLEGRHQPALDFVFSWAEQGHPERVPILLGVLFGNGVNTDTWWWHRRDRRIMGTKVNALHLASIMGLEDVVEDFLARIPSHLVDLGDSNGRSALFYAVAMTTDSLPFRPQEYPDKCSGKTQWRGSIRIVKMLLKHGADPDFETRTNASTPQMLAARNTDRSFRTVFAEGLVRQEKDSGEDTEYSSLDEDELLQ